MLVCMSHPRNNPSWWNKDLWSILSLIPLHFFYIGATNQIRLDLYLEFLLEWWYFNEFRSNFVFLLISLWILWSQEVKRGPASRVSLEPSEFESSIFSSLCLHYPQKKGREKEKNPRKIIFLCLKLSSHGYRYTPVTTEWQLPPRKRMGKQILASRCGLVEVYKSYSKSRYKSKLYVPPLQRNSLGQFIQDNKKKSIVISRSNVGTKDLYYCKMNSGKKCRRINIIFNIPLCPVMGHIS